jgi:hypothetical protein
VDVQSGERSVTREDGSAPQIVDDVDVDWGLIGVGMVAVDRLRVKYIYKPDCNQEEKM